MNNLAFKSVYFKIKAFSENHSSIFWLIILFLLVTLSKGIEVGIIFIGLMISGFSLGKLIPMTFGIFINNIEFKLMLKELIIFTVSSTMLYIYLDNTKLLALMIPFSIPLLIIGFLNLKR